MQLAYPYFLILKSFFVMQQDKHTEVHSIKSGVLQGSVLEPILYLVSTADLPSSPKTEVASNFLSSSYLFKSHNNSIKKSTSGPKKMRNLVEETTN